MIFFSLNLLKLFQYYPEIQSIFILFSPYLHLISIHSPFILHSLFVHCSFIVRLLFVHRSSFVRHLFVLCSFARAARTVFCSSHFSVTTLPLLGRGLGRGYFVRSLFICPCSSHRLLFLLASNNLQFATLFPSSKNFSHFISHLLIFKFANSTYPCTTLYLLSFTF